MKACPLCLSTFEDAVRFCPYHGEELKSLPNRQYGPGAMVGNYRLVKHIGADGLGNIFHAECKGVNFRLRIFSEALLCSQPRRDKLTDLLSNNAMLLNGVPHIEHVEDYDFVDDGTLYCVNRLLPRSRSFRNIANDEHITETDTANLLYMLLQSVHEIHSQHAVHGGLSLNNIFLDETGHVHIFDCGLWNVFMTDQNQFVSMRDDHSKLFEAIVDLMAPEVAKGNPPTTASDVYSCGAVAACLLTLPSIESKSVDERMKSHLRETDFDLSSISNDTPVSSDFSDCIHSATLGSQGVRFQNANAFKKALCEVFPHLETETAIADTLASRFFLDSWTSKGPSLEAPKLEDLAQTISDIFGDEPDDLGDASKPHNRISRKKEKAPQKENKKTQKGNAQIKPGDVVAMDNVDSSKHSHKRNPNNPEDCIPQGEIITATLEIKPATCAQDLPKYSHDPTMTVTGGYEDIHEEGTDFTREDADIGDAITNPNIQALKDDEQAEAAQQAQAKEDAKAQQKKKAKTILAIIIVLAIVLAVFAAYIISEKREQSDIKQAKNNVELQAKNDKKIIQDFEHKLSQINTEEGRRSVLISYNKIKKEQSQNVIRECRARYINALQNLDRSIRDDLKKSNDYPDYFVIDTEAINESYTECRINQMKEGDDENSNACIILRDKAILQAHKDALAKAAEHQSEFENLKDKWNELVKIDNELLSLQNDGGGSLIKDLDSDLMQAQQETQNFAGRLDRQDKASDEIANMTAELTYKVQDDSSLVQIMPDNSQTDTGLQDDRNAAIAAIDPQQQIEQPTDQGPTQQPNVQNVLVQNTPNPSQNSSRANNTSSRISSRSSSSSRVSSSRSRRNRSSSQMSDNMSIAPISSSNDDAFAQRPDGSVPTGKLIVDAQVAMTKNDYNAAVALLEQATKQDPTNPRAWMVLARANDVLGKLNTAISNASLSCGIQKTAACYVFLGDLHTKAGHTQEANDAYSRALAIDPKNAAAKSKLKVQ